MKKLILTGYPDFFPKREDEKDALYLGPWCFAFHPDYDILEATERFSFAGSPYADWGDVAKAEAYTNGLIDRMLPHIANMLNQTHHTDKSVAYWRVVVMYWLLHWVEAFYDRYLRLRYFLDTSEASGFCCDIFEVQDVASLGISNNGEFIEHYCKGHVYNHFLFSQILEVISDLRGLNLRRHRVDIKSLLEEERKILKESQEKWADQQGALEPSPQESREPVLSRLLWYRALRFVYRIFLRIWLEWLTEKLQIAWDVFVRDTRRFAQQIVVGDIFPLSSHLRGKVLGLDGVFDYSSVFAKAQKARRRSADSFAIEPWQKGFVPQNEFERILHSAFPMHLLLEFLLFPKWKLPENLIAWVGEDNVSFPLNHAVAELREKGGKWLCMQHGGGYGNFLIFPIGKMEYESSDAFLTWGWNYQHAGYRFHPIPFFMPTLPKTSKKQEPLAKNFSKNGIFLVATAHPTYYYRFHSTLLPEDQPDYIANRIAFVKRLSKDAKDALVYKPYHADYGHKEEKVLSNFIPANQYYKKVNFSPEDFLDFGLIVIDHMSTGFLHALSLNVPTVLFWDPGHFTECKEAAPYFDELREVRILFDDPESAASHVNQIYPGGIDDWWNGEKVQKVRERFCNTYARVSENPLADWKSLLDKIESGELWN